MSTIYEPCNVGVCVCVCMFVDPAIEFDIRKLYTIHLRFECEKKKQNQIVMFFCVFVFDFVLTGGFSSRTLSIIFTVVQSK